jgi:hypothetical protein
MWPSLVRREYMTYRWRDVGSHPAVCAYNSATTKLAKALRSAPRRAASPLHRPGTARRSLGGRGKPWSGHPSDAQRGARSTVTSYRCCWRDRASCRNRGYPRRSHQAGNQRDFRAYKGSAVPTAGRRITKRQRSALDLRCSALAIVLGSPQITDTRAHAAHLINA